MFPTYFVRLYYVRLFLFNLEYSLSDVISRKLPIYFVDFFVPTLECILSYIMPQKSRTVCRFY